jgi:hypothetical protein
MTNGFSSRKVLKNIAQRLKILDKTITLPEATVIKYMCERGLVPKNKDYKAIDDIDQSTLKSIEPSGVKGVINSILEGVYKTNPNKETIKEELYKEYNDYVLKVNQGNPSF